MADVGKRVAGTDEIRWRIDGPGGDGATARTPMEELSQSLRRGN